MIRYQIEWLKGTLSRSVSEEVIAQSCEALCDPMDCRLLGSSVYPGFWGKKAGWGCHLNATRLVVFHQRSTRKGALWRTQPRLTWTEKSPYSVSQILNFHDWHSTHPHSIDKFFTMVATWCSGVVEGRWTSCLTPYDWETEVGPSNLCFKKPAMWFWCTQGMKQLGHSNFKAIGAFKLFIEAVFIYQLYFEKITSQTAVSFEVK